jgi:hypothetical protein
MRLSQGEPEVQPAYYLYICGVAQSIMHDSLGNITDTSGRTSGTAVPDVVSHRLGGQAQSFVLPSTETYTVTFRSGDLPLLIDITRGTGAAKTQAIRYLDLALPPNVTAMLRLTPQGVEDLRYDADGDGTYETDVPPTASVNDASAADTEPPTLKVEVAGPIEARMVTIIAMDAGAGVKQVLYSLDGMNFQPYTTPILADVTRLHTLYAFADDAVANRSGLLVQSLAQVVYLPAVGRQ